MRQTVCHLLQFVTSLICYSSVRSNQPRSSRLSHDVPFENMNLCPMSNGITSMLDNLHLEKASLSRFGIANIYIYIYIYIYCSPLQ